MKKKIALLLTLVLALAACQAQALTLAGLERSENNIWSENAFFDAVLDATGVALSIEECHDEQAWTAQKQAWLRGEGEMLHPNSSEYKNYGTYSKAIAEKAAADNVVNESVKEKLEIFQRENQYLHDQIKIKDEQIASLLALLTNKPKEV